MWFTIALKDLAGGNLNPIPKGTILKITSFSEKCIVVKRINKSKNKDDQNILILHQPAWWSESIGFNLCRK